MYSFRLNVIKTLNIIIKGRKDMLTETTSLCCFCDLRATWLRAKLECVCHWNWNRGINEAKDNVPGYIMIIPHPYAEALLRVRVAITSFVAVVVVVVMVTDAKWIPFVESDVGYWSDTEIVLWWHDRKRGCLGRLRWSCLQTRNHISIRTRS